MSVDIMNEKCEEMTFRLVWWWRTFPWAVCRIPGCWLALVHKLVIRGIIYFSLYIAPNNKSRIQVPRGNLDRVTTDHGRSSWWYSDGFSSPWSLAFPPRNISTSRDVHEKTSGPWYVLTSDDHQKNKDEENSKKLNNDKTVDIEWLLLNWMWPWDPRHD